MTDWELLELRSLFEKLSKEAESWEATKVMSRTKHLGELVTHQLEEYTEGKYRTDRNEARGFFEAINKFSATGLPLSLDHFEGLIQQYAGRITPYPHYSGIKLKVPIDFADLDHLKVEDIPEEVADSNEKDEGSTLTLM